MGVFPEPGRQAAHVLLDGIVAREPGAPLAVNSAATELAWQRIIEIDGALNVTASEGEHGLNVTVDLSSVLGSALITLDRLVERVSEATGESREEVVADLRRYVDQ